MKNYIYRKDTRTSIGSVATEVGETIEEKVERIVANKEPITDGAPEIFTERKDGIIPGYNIRTDRFEVAAEAMDKVTRSKIASRDRVAKMDVVKDDDKSNDGPEKAGNGESGA